MSHLARDAVLQVSGHVTELKGGHYLMSMCGTKHKDFLQ